MIRKRSKFRITKVSVDCFEHLSVWYTSCCTRFRMQFDRQAFHSVQLTVSNAKFSAWAKKDQLQKGDKRFRPCPFIRHVPLDSKYQVRKWSTGGSSGAHRRIDCIVKRNIAIGEEYSKNSLHWQYPSSRSLISKKTWSKVKLYNFFMSRLVGD